ncbi:MAG: hypothetical protein N2487_02710 [Verrucomicrobiae bacterium]|nr:hypothetical protein [Verrucomicrobiae bacterium]
MNRFVSTSVLNFRTICWIVIVIGCCEFGCCSADGGSIKICGIESNKLVVSQGVYDFGVCVLFSSDSIDGVWRPVANKYITDSVLSFGISNEKPICFYRVCCAEILPTPAGFTNLIKSYGVLTTIAGAGGTGNDVNKWMAEFEGGPAVNALLSRPHIAMADRCGNVYIADKSAHAIRKVDKHGLIHTIAGINSPGDGADGPSVAREVALNEPNGLYVLPDGVIYILDLANLKVRRLATNGIMETVCYIPDLTIGRGLWVSEDESTIYVASGGVVYRWGRNDGLEVYASGFIELGNVVVAPDGNLVVTDRGGHRVVKILPDRTQVVIAGNGMTYGGGDGYRATETGLNEVRGVWFLADGSFFVCTHRGSQIWYIDRGGYIHLFLNGYRSNTHAGDGQWFYNPYEYRISEVRAVVVDYEGNILITENDSGYIRKIEFLWHGY